METAPQKSLVQGDSARPGNAERMKPGWGKDQGTHDYEPLYKGAERDRDEHSADQNDHALNRRGP